MSNIMREIEQSEHQNRSLKARDISYHQAPLRSSQKKKRLLNVLLLLLPPIIVSGGVAFDVYTSKKYQRLEENSQNTMAENVAFHYQASKAPDFGYLNSTVLTPDIHMAPLTVYEEKQPVTKQDSDDASKEVAVASEKPNVDNTHLAKSDDLLSNIDLSDISPEIAERFKSAIKDRNEQVTEDIASNSSNISHHPERWNGKLPAMNFQTHVYSSKLDKRWVKVSGTEYGQGDWINEEVELVAIEPQSCLVRFKGELIKIPALYDWKG